jgi:hypothetical protein
MTMKPEDINNTQEAASLHLLGSGTPDKSGASDVELARSGVGGVLNIGIEMPMPTKTFTRYEWDELTKDDPVLAFIARVNAAALAKPYWGEDFRRALYDSFCEEHGRYAVEKYNSGEPFCISGAERRGDDGESQSRAGSTTVVFRDGAPEASDSK